jgi:hypothetical protein
VRQSCNHYCPQASHNQTANIPVVEEKFISYLNVMWQFGYEISDETCQLKTLETTKEIGIEGSTEI